MQTRELFETCGAETLLAHKAALLNEAKLVDEILNECQPNNGLVTNNAATSAAKAVVDAQPQHAIDEEQQLQTAKRMRKFTLSVGSDAMLTWESSVDGFPVRYNVMLKAAQVKSISAIVGDAIRRAKARGLPRWYGLSRRRTNIVNIAAND